MFDYLVDLLELLGIDTFEEYAAMCVVTTFNSLRLGLYLGRFTVR